MIGALSSAAAGWATAHEAQKTALQELLLEAGVTLQYHTRIAGAVVEAGCVKGVITESKSGREVILAHTVIDATGDGDLAARAGATFRLGRCGDGLLHAYGQSSGRARLEKLDELRRHRLADDDQRAKRPLPHLREGVGSRFEDEGELREIAGLRQ